MRYILFSTLITTLLLSCQSLPSTNIDSDFVLTNFGRFDSGNGNETNFVKAQNVTGKLIVYKNSYPFIIDHEGSFKASLKTDFGIEISISNSDRLKDKQIKVVVIHPKITNPDTGVSTTVDSYFSTLKKEKFVQFGWILNHDYEVVSGKWTFQIFSNEKMVISQDIILN